MKLTLRKGGAGKRRIDGWLLFAVIMFALIGTLSYLFLFGVSADRNATTLSILNQECGSYAAQLTSELAVNSTACLTANQTGVANATRFCGLTYYCYYASSCQSSATVKNNSLNCLCDAFKPTQVIFTGFCFNQGLG